MFEQIWLNKSHTGLSDLQRKATAACRNKFLSTWAHEKPGSDAVDLMEACERDMMRAWDRKEIEGFIQQSGAIDAPRELIRDKMRVR